MEQKKGRSRPARRPVSRKPARRPARKPTSGSKRPSAKKTTPPKRRTIRSTARGAAKRTVKKTGTPPRRPSRSGNAISRGAARRTARKTAPPGIPRGRGGNPVPKPKVRRPARKAATGTAVAGAAVGVAASASQELAVKVQAIRSRYEGLAAQAQLSGIYDAIGDIDSLLTELPFAVDELRARGYVHSRQMEDKLAALAAQWDETRPRVESTLESQVRRLDKDLSRAETKVTLINPRNPGSIRAADTAVNSLSNQINAARNAVTGLYDGLQQELQSIKGEIGKIETVLALFDESPEIQLLEAEGPLLAVKAIWRRDGDDGPEGILFLTDQRLLFEQREEVVTKKRFGLFKAESEMVQKLLVETNVYEIESLVDKEEGGFLGMGKDDVLEMTFAATAPLSRAKFHLKGQDSADWAAMIKRVQTGEIDQHRAEEYQDDIEEALAMSASFPAQCPTCFAAVPEQPRGVTSYTCEFCGTVITPVAE